MKVAFFGTPAPAAKILQALISAKHEIICVVTQPDRPRGRGQKVAFSSVKEVALKYNLPIEQPEKVKNNPVFVSLIKSLKPDIGIIVAYGKILPKELLEIPKFGFINVHASLLPKYRGAAPVQWALLKGEKETGITIMKVVEQLDAGDIILQEKVKIKIEDTTESLTKRLFECGESLLVRALGKIEKGTAKFIQQNEAEATYAPSITKESGEIDWKKPVIEIHNRIRAMVPWPVAHTFFGGKLLKIWKSEIYAEISDKQPQLPGAITKIVKNQGLVVRAGEGELLVLEVQLEGKRRMGAYDFLIGHSLKSGDTFPN